VIWQGESWRIMRVKAIENQVFTVSAGVANQPACGTIIVAPKFKDEILAEADSKEQIIYAELDLAWLRERRKGSPLYSLSIEEFRSQTITEKIETHCFLKDRRTELYKLKNNQT